jgi:hypothetical protein
MEGLALGLLDMLGLADGQALGAEVGLGVGLKDGAYVLVAFTLTKQD